MTPISHFDTSKVVFRTPMGDPVYYHKDGMIVAFEGKRAVTGTCNLNGGFRTDLRYLFNHSCGRHPLVLKKECPGLQGFDIVEHYAFLARELDLPPEVSTGMSTSALIENGSTATMSYHGVEVMTIATAGIDVNGGRAGDKAAYDEFEEKDLLPPAGTINIFVFINAHLDPGAMSRAIVTATEAKASILQELMACSRYSEDIATGSGTDGVIIVSNEESPIHLHYTGKHVLVGEMIGQTVRRSIAQALANQTGMTPQRQASIEWQGKRYDITAERILRYYRHIYPDMEIGDKKTQETLETMIKAHEILSPVVGIIHLIDQHRWGILLFEHVLDTAQSMLDTLLSRHGLPPIDLQRKRTHKTSKPPYQSLISDICLTLAHLLHKRLQNG
ncbi:adenosylcobinamide amidohydrolase [Porphyromonas sp.]|uniref:adenosylcobinamide amidohydrolase n=1 Tax=Porphyromonas sp. TaxID=1924944 RepID=UPI0026DAF4CB|nr:adenosylcobinamide amidohydrolase [Porphyromonas sp.]MDO4771310.1 adenosylcobinamide amidohydrolase [Porphyromonas sp.]